MSLQNSDKKLFLTRRDTKKSILKIVGFFRGEFQLQLLGSFFASYLPEDKLREPFEGTLKSEG